MSDGFVLNREGGRLRVTLGVELTVGVVPELRELLCAIQDDGVTDLELDFANTTTLDTAGLSLLLATRNSFSGDHKSVKMINLQLPISSLLETLRLYQRLNCR